MTRKNMLAAAVAAGNHPKMVYALVRKSDGLVLGLANVERALVVNDDRIVVVVPFGTNLYDVAMPDASSPDHVRVVKPVFVGGDK